MSNRDVLSFPPHYADDAVLMTELVKAASEAFVEYIAAQQKHGIDFRAMDIVETEERYHKKALELAYFVMAHTRGVPLTPAERDLQSDMQPLLGGNNAL